MNRAPGPQELIGPWLHDLSSSESEGPRLSGIQPNNLFEGVDTATMLAMQRSLKSLQAIKTDLGELLFDGNLVSYMNSVRSPPSMRPGVPRVSCWCSETQ